MIRLVLKGIIALEILGILYFIIKAACLYFKYGYGYNSENTIEENVQKVEVFLDNPKVIEKINSLKEIPYQG